MSPKITAHGGANPPRVRSFGQMLAEARAATPEPVGVEVAPGLVFVADEADEPVEDVQAAFEAGEQGVTAEPDAEAEADAPRKPGRPRKVNGKGTATVGGVNG